MHPRYIQYIQPEYISDVSQIHSKYVAGLHPKATGSSRHITVRSSRSSDRQTFVLAGHIYTVGRHFRSIQTPTSSIASPRLPLCLPFAPFAARLAGNSQSAAKPRSVRTYTSIRAVYCREVFAGAASRPRLSSLPHVVVVIASATYDAVVGDASWSKPLPRHLLAVTSPTAKDY
mgnify:FL=1